MHYPCHVYLPTASLFKCDFSYSSAAYHNIAVTFLAKLIHQLIIRHSRYVFEC